jgi:signal transduction histidine kinase
LRQPISRIIANAETIRSRLAGPLAEAYGAYAADIAEAGRHLLGLVDDLADLDAVEAPALPRRPTISIWPTAPAARQASSRCAPANAGSN